jgi:hypothetical protein
VLRPAVELADIFREHGPGYRQSHALPLDQLRVMRAIEICRTAALGGHIEQCSHCPYTYHAYNSCRYVASPLAHSSASNSGEIREHSVAGTLIRSHSSPPCSHSSQKNPRFPQGVLISHKSPFVAASDGRIVRYNWSSTRAASSIGSKDAE